MTVRMPRNCEIAIRDGIATVTMTRDDRRNALDVEALLELKSAFTEMVEDRTARVLVLTGTGNTFSSGADLSPIKGVTDPEERRRIFAPHGARIADLLGEVVRVLLSPKIVTVAAVNGHAAGGGWLLAMGCDFQIAAEDARFWFPEIELGRAVNPLTCAVVTAQAGPVLAREILMTGRRYTARDLLARGQLNEVVPAAGLGEAAARLAASLAGFDSTALYILKNRIGGFALATAGETERGAP